MTINFAILQFYSILYHCFQDGTKTTNYNHNWSHGPTTSTTMVYWAEMLIYTIIGHLANCEHRLLIAVVRLFCCHRMSQWLLFTSLSCLSSSRLCFFDVLLLCCLELLLRSSKILCLHCCFTLFHSPSLITLHL